MGAPKVNAGREARNQAATAGQGASSPGRGLPPAPGAPAPARPPARGGPATAWRQDHLYSALSFPQVSVCAGVFSHRLVAPGEGVQPVPCGSVVPT